MCTSLCSQALGAAESKCVSVYVSKCKLSRMLLLFAAGSLFGDVRERGRDVG